MSQNYMKPLITSQFYKIVLVKEFKALEYSVNFRLNY